MGKLAKRMMGQWAMQHALTETPDMDKLKAGRSKLTPEERKQVIDGGAVWPGTNNPGVWKAIVGGKTYFVCNTHRAFQAKTTLAAAIKVFPEIEATG